MKYARKIKDKRLFGGDRVIAKCKIMLPITDPFAHYNNIKTGYVVLNMRGGCLYIGESIDECNISKIFPDGENAVFQKMGLSAKNQSDILICNLKVAFIRLRKEINREGIVFKYTDLTEMQMDLLYTAQYTLPAIGASEESSVPFDDIISLDRRNIRLVRK